MFHIVCTACDGARANDGEPCAKCDGTGRESVYRCPASHADASLGAAFLALSWAESGTLPVAGGLLDQSASFVRFVQVVSMERAAMDEERERERKAREGLKHGSG